MESLKKCKSLLLCVPVLWLQFSSFAPQTGDNSPLHVYHIKYYDLEQMMNRSNDTTYVYNFWATWCPPCVHEFPDFQKFSAENAGKKFKLVFISLDFAREFKSKLLPFVANHNVKEDVYLLDEPDYNSWIPKIDTNWDGGLPATLVVNAKYGIYRMYPHDFTLQGLDTTVKQFIY